MRRGLLAGWADGWRARRLLDSREDCVQAWRQSPSSRRWQLRAEFWEMASLARAASTSLHFANWVVFRHGINVTRGTRGEIYLIIKYISAT